MESTSRKLNNLYIDMLSDSPKTVTIHIPKDMGKGKISQVVTRQGAVFSDWEMNYYSDMNVQGINSQEYIQILFCLNEGVSWNIASESQGVHISKGESCIYRGHGKMEYLCYMGKRDFLFKSVKIPADYFLKILHDYFEPRETELYERKLMDGISQIAITPYMEHIFAELKDFSQYCGGLGYLFLESKILELLSVYLGEVLELNILASGQVYVSKSERESILEAKRIIDSQLAFAPGCSKLAQMVHLSTTKLTKGFSAMFGNSIHAYVIEQRLKKAAGLLLDSDLNITEVSAAVGYSKPSNFSAAFKKKYGVLPKQYKEQKTIK